MCIFLHVLWPRKCDLNIEFKGVLLLRKQPLNIENLYFLSYKLEDCKLESDWYFGSQFFLRTFHFFMQKKTPL